MKRIIPLLFLLFLMNGCGTVPTQANSNPPAESETAVTSSLPEAENCNVLMLPNPGFEPDTYWIADDFGNCGQAMLLMADNGDFLNLKCFFNQHVPAPEQASVESILGCYTFEAVVHTGVSFPVDRTDGTAVLEIEGDRLFIRYAGTEKPMPERFSRVDYDIALEEYRDMPYNDECSLPLAKVISHDEILNIPGVERIGNDEYRYKGAVIQLSPEYEGSHHIWSITAQSNDFLPNVRGVKIGCSASEVLSRFPGENTVLNEGDYIIYGTDDLLSADGRVYSDGDRRVILFCDNDSIIRFFIGSNDTVEEIQWTWIL